MAKPIEKKALLGLECKLAVLDEIGSETDTKAMTFTGYGSVFSNIDSYGDIMAPGCFQKSIERHIESGTKPIMFLNHQHDSLPIGEWTSIEEDEYGLKLTGELLDSTAGIDTYKALKKGLIKGLSIGFYSDAWEMAANGDAHRRTITEADLFEVSVVNVPANTSALVSEIKSSIDEMGIRDLERLLRDRGLSRKEAEKVASQFESKKYLAALEAKRKDREEFEARLKRLLGK